MKLFYLIFILVILVTGCNEKDGNTLPGPFAGITSDSSSDQVIEGSIDSDSAMPAPIKELSNARKKGSGLVGKELILLDSDTNILATRVVNESDKKSDGSYYYMFRGNFSNKTLKLKIPNENSYYELLLGDYPTVSAEDIDKNKIEIGKFNIKRETIASRICEEREKVDPGFSHFDIRDREIISEISDYTENYLNSSIDDIIEKLDRIKVNPYFPDEVYIEDSSHINDNIPHPPNFTDVTDDPLIEMSRFPVRNKIIKAVYAGSGTSELELVYSPGKPLPIRYKSSNPLIIKVLYDEKMKPSSYISFSAKIYYSSATDYLSFSAGDDIKTAFSEDDNSVTLTFGKDFRPSSTGKMVFSNSGAGTKILPDGTVVTQRYFPVPTFEIY